MEEGNVVQEELTAYYKRLLSLLFYNTCKCLLKKEGVELKLNPKFHRKKCPYRLKVEEAGLEFKEDGTE